MQIFARHVILTKKTETFSTACDFWEYFFRIFMEVTDPRRTSKGNYRHKLSDILLLVISAVLCGANDWDEIELFGKEQESWLRSYGDFANGIPSHDTINRIFSRINPAELSRCFTSWANGLRVKKGKKKIREVIAIDGKRVRNSYVGTRKSSALHIVSALAAQSNICIGQVSTHEKSNEITAIPQLLSLIDIKGDIVSIDAMGCQREIAKKIRKAKADYILAVKGNQESLEEAIKDTILLGTPDSEDIDIDCGHGRIETRRCRTYTDFSYLDNISRWKDLSCLVEIQAQRIKKNTGKTEMEKRYYISSLKADAKDFNEWIRSHWAVENKLHWVLDVTFKEDFSRKRKDYAAQNFNTALKFVLTMLSKDKSFNGSYKKKRARAALNTQFREIILRG